MIRDEHRMIKSSADTLPVGRSSDLNRSVSLRRGAVAELSIVGGKKSHLIQEISKNQKLFDNCFETKSEETLEQARAVVAKTGCKGAISVKGTVHPIQGAVHPIETVDLATDAALLRNQSLSEPFGLRLDRAHKIGCRLVTERLSRGPLQ